MITNPLLAGHYAPTNQLLLSRFLRDAEELRLGLMDKAAEAALSGNPKRAHYYEEWMRAPLGPA